MSRYATMIGKEIILSGDTYSIKDSIKGVGGKWDSAKKCWKLDFDSTKIDLLKNLGFSFPSVEKKESSLDVEKSEIVKYYKVEEILQLVGIQVQKIFPTGLGIEGEITSLKYSHGNLFFDLCSTVQDVLGEKQRPPTLKCSLWSSQLQLLERTLGKLDLRDGLQIRVFGSLSIYHGTSSLSFTIQNIDMNFTQGNLALKKENIRKELKMRNLYDKNKQKRFPLLPMRIALLTSLESRAQTDFLHELQLSSLAFKITLYSVRMQGNYTSFDVALALQEIEKKREDFDVIIITRGGGSRMDLSYFDDLEICKQIAYSSLPVITAIGHFEDSSLADEVAFLQEKTPTAAARFLVQKVYESLSLEYERLKKVCVKVQGRLRGFHEQLTKYEEKLTSLARNRLEREYLYLKKMDFKGKLILASYHRLEKEKKYLQRAENSLKIARAQSEAPLKRGFWRLQSVSSLKENQEATFETFVQEENGEYSCLVVEVTVQKMHKKQLEE